MRVVLKIIKGISGPIKAGIETEDREGVASLRSEVCRDGGCSLVQRDESGDGEEDQGNWAGKGACGVGSTGLGGCCGGRGFA
jgi:hypothetical protein